jgi:hypothetical protein
VGSSEGGATLASLAACCRELLRAIDSTGKYPARCSGGAVAAHACVVVGVWFQGLKLELLQQQQQQQQQQQLAPVAPAHARNTCPQV